MRFFRPTLADALFVLLLLRVLQLGSVDLFNDPGTGWHLRTGGGIVACAAVPIADSYSYTRRGYDWVETQWLADVLMSVAYNLGGYPLLALVTAVLIAALFRWIYRRQVTAGGWPAIAILTTLAAVCAASVHFLARPLVASSIGVPLSFWWATQYARGRVSAKRLWLLVPIAAVWANCHPGVLGGIVTVVICGLGALASAVLPFNGYRRGELAQRGLLLLLAGAGMGAATLVNPYGLDWHLWVLRLMKMKVLAGYVDEWLPPSWADPSTVAAALLVGVAVWGTIVRRKGTALGEALVLGFWTVQGFSSVRHIPLLAMIAALQVGRVLAGATVDWRALRRLGARVPLFSAAIRDAEARTGGGLASLVAVCLSGLVAWSGMQISAVGLHGAGPSADRFSTGAVACLSSKPSVGPIFNDLTHGGTLIHELPDVAVFVDDRFGLYGEDFFLQYRDVVKYPDEFAERALSRWRIETVLIGTHLALCDWLAENEEWREAYRDEVAAVFTKRDPALAANDVPGEQSNCVTP